MKLWSHPFLTNGCDKKNRGPHHSPRNENRTKIGVIYPHFRSGNEDTVADASKEGVVGNEDTDANASKEGVVGNKDTAPVAAKQGVVGNEDTVADASKEGVVGNKDTVADALFVPLLLP